MTSMLDQIPPLPDIPERLRLAAHLGTLVPFIGAGVSRLGGCPSWNDFADGALRFFVDKGLLSHGQFELLSKLEARVKLSIAQGLEDEHRTQIDFKALLTPRGEKAKRAGDEVHRQLWKLSSTIITTNYDEWLDTPLPPAMQHVASTRRDALMPPPTTPQVLYRPADFTVANLNIQPSVFHIHGSVRERDTMVFTTAQYLKLYAGHAIDGDQLNENSYLSFLRTLFRVKNVLFIGYGLKELEILEYVIQKARSVKQAMSPRVGPQAERRHYLLQGFYSHELELMRNLKSYYARECDIGLLPFSLEQRGHAQLLDIVTYLSREVASGGLVPQQEWLEMEELLK